MNVVARKQWRESVREEALDPELPIVDAHHHLWRVPPVPTFDSYDAEALLDDIEACGHNIVATVHVDAMSNYRTDGPEDFRTVGETEYLERVAAEAVRRNAPAICAGIVANANLRLGKRVAPVLAAHRAASPSRLRGIRNITSHDPDNPHPGASAAGILMMDDFREGFAQLAPAGLSFDASLLHPQLPELLDLARKFPQTTIILNHTGKPIRVGRYANRREEGYREWKQSMAALAACDNVVVKLGGLNMDHPNLWQIIPRPPNSEEAAAAQREYMLPVVDLFGCARCMCESNFPVDMLGISYGVFWNSLKRLFADFSVADKAQLFSQTAIKTYRLDLPAAKMQQ